MLEESQFQAPDIRKQNSGRTVAPTINGAPGYAGMPDFESNAYGSTNDMPYSFQKVATYGQVGPSSEFYQVPVTSRPHRFTGKLYMRFGGSWFVCTASLVKRGVLVTAAHCVHNYGQGASGFADEVRWYPANYSPQGGPWGFYTGLEIFVPTPYVNGTDTCTVSGVVCNNDIATVVLTIRGKHAGDGLGGWYNYGWNGYGFVNSSLFGETVNEITQLGYPVAWDNGYHMLRNNSFGVYDVQTGTNGQQVINTILGSPMTGGSSGGPWLVNFGTAPWLTNSSEATTGTDAARNMVVGTTSWGYVNAALNIQGASWFGQNYEYPAADYGGRGAGNIGSLMRDTCNAYPSYC
ncbi:MAG: trypsin-like serine protease [Pseudomonadota bacterium]